MKPITPSAHGYLDYVTVAVFLLAPKLLGFDGLPALLSWTVGRRAFGAHASNGFPARLAPLAAIFNSRMDQRESLVPHWSSSPSWREFSDGGSASGFYLLMGLVIIAVGWLTDYSGGTEQALRPSL